MAAVTIVGAGSARFSLDFIRDLCATPSLWGGALTFMDLDRERLELVERLARRYCRETGADYRITATTDRRRALEGADYVIVTIMVGRFKAYALDIDIPAKYGVYQCIGDTIGPGGIFKALRTLPAWIDILADTEDLAPDALVMNYTNPMSLTCLTGVRASSLPIVGLCHSIQHTSEQVADYLGIPYDELNIRAAGINHLAWLVDITRNGEDMYPLLREKAKDPAIYEQDPIRFETMLHLGAFPTEGSGHSSEYTPYFRKRPDLVEKYARDGYLGETGFYANNWPQWRAEADDDMRRIIAGEDEIELERGPEFASHIVEAMETNVPAVIYGNVPNTGLITNLPQDGVVEVACLVNKMGVQPTYFGALPAQLAALNAAHMTVHDLVATAVLEHNAAAAFYALMLDPLTAAVCSPAEIRSMFDEMVEAQTPFLPEWIHG